jgi:hypothetical protein
MDTLRTRLEHAIAEMRRHEIDLRGDGMFNHANTYEHCASLAAAALEEAPATGCPCEPEGRDGLRCPDANGRLLCAPEQPGSSVQGEAVRPGYRHIVHELLTNIKRACIRGRNAAQTENNQIATCDHVENLADEALGYLTTPPPAPAAEQDEHYPLAVKIARAKETVQPEGPAADQGNDNNLPGMWSHTDFTGGDPDERSHAQRAQPEARGVEGMVLVPKELAERVMDALFRFTGDEGWTTLDMDVAEAFCAILTTPNPVRAEQPEGKRAAHFVVTVTDGNWTGTFEDWQTRCRAHAPAAPGVRVDEATQDAIDSILNKLHGWSRAYPADIFHEPTKEERDWLHATRPGLMDCIAASMGRHISGMIAADLANLAAALATDSGDAARWRSFRKTISIHADGMTPERWDKREDDFMADYADAYGPAALAKPASGDGLPADDDETLRLLDARKDDALCREAADLIRRLATPEQPATPAVVTDEDVKRALCAAYGKQPPHTWPTQVRRDMRAALESFANKEPTESCARATDAESEFTHREPTPWAPTRRFGLWKLERRIWSNWAGSAYEWYRYPISGFVRRFWTRAQAEAFAKTLNENKA